MCDALGLETSDYSFPYVAAWSNGDVEKIKETGGRVTSCAREILRFIAAREYEYEDLG